MTPVTFEGLFLAPLPCGRSLICWLSPPGSLWFPFGHFCFSPCGRSSLASGRFHVQRGSVLVLYAASPFSPFSNVHFVRLGDFGTSLTLTLAVCMVGFRGMAILSV